MEKLMLITAALFITSLATAKNDKSAYQLTEGWPETAKMAAKKTIEKYGAPDEATAHQLVWHNNGPWKRTIISKMETAHDFPMPHKDVMEQFVELEVPADKLDELAAYDGSVIVDRTRGEISARCDKEEANFLALNLADDIIDGEKNVEQARAEYAQHVKDMMAGKKSEYVSGFTFKPAKTDITVRDVAVMKK